MSESPAATLKLVVVDLRASSLATVERELVGIAGENEVRDVGGNAFVVHTALGTAALRDRLQPLLSASASALVAEFETWSGYGAEIDSVWLMRRGH